MATSCLWSRTLQSRDRTVTMVTRTSSERYKGASQGWPLSACLSFVCLPLLTQWMHSTDFNLICQFNFNIYHNSGAIHVTVLWRLKMFWSAVLCICLHVNSLTPEELLLLFICCLSPNEQLLLTANNPNATVLSVWALCVLCAAVACQTLS